MKRDPSQPGAYVPHKRVTMASISTRGHMKITTPSPVRTAHRVRQLAGSFPLECARALQQQPEAIPEVGRSLAYLAEQPSASQILVETLRRNPRWANSASAFYQRRRELSPAPTVPVGFLPEITTSLQRP
jgi:hypothetical protein